MTIRSNQNQNKRTLQFPKCLNKKKVNRRTWLSKETSSNLFQTWDETFLLNVFPFSKCQITWNLKQICFYQSHTAELDHEMFSFKNENPSWARWTCLIRQHSCDICNVIICFSAVQKFMSNWDFRSPVEERKFWSLSRKISFPLNFEIRFLKNQI